MDESRSGAEKANDDATAVPTGEKQDAARMPVMFLAEFFLVPVSCSCYRQARYWPGVLRYPLPNLDLERKERASGRDSRRARASRRQRPASP